MYASVIVDVPVIAVNRPFDYLVPTELEDLIEVGMRVAVPFHFRSVQGFVLNLKEETDFEGEIKEIDRLMDIEPVLTPELVQLGQVMADQVYAFLIQCYQTMLPPMLKSQYARVATLLDPAAYPEDFARLFSYQKDLEITDQLLPQQMSRLTKLRQLGAVEIKTLVLDRAKIKTQTWIKPKLTPDDYQEIYEGLRASAHTQKRLVRALAQLPVREMPKKVFMETYELRAPDVKKAYDQGWLDLFEKELSRDPFEGRTFEVSQNLELNEQQALAFEQVAQSMNQGKVYLLEGVTGSGKTELYLQWIGLALKENKTAMMLVPEIALTPQMVNRFKSRFGDLVAVLHSGLNPGEKYDEWRKIKEGKARIVVGARSSVFAPLDKIGMIILDEEHEATYKQDEAPRYHARDMAIWRGAYHSCPVILGSATPSLDSRARAQKGVYGYLSLPHRAKQQALPPVQIVDMRAELGKNKSSISQALAKALEDGLEKKEQSVLLLNRRGYSSFLMCRDCGYVLECPNCDISLTLHMDSKTMKCHYCGHEEGIPRTCRKCGSRQVRYFGTGTQKVEEEVQALFPQAKIIRMDVDTTKGKGQHEKLLDAFERQEAQILIGTQMIAKGLDFPNVTLVGVVNADTGLNLPDFRSAEKSFQLLTQVAGRAGRGDKSGQVIIQTFNPDHYAIQYAQGHDYQAFYRHEMQMRHLAKYPPYYYTLLLTISSEKEGKAYLKAAELKKILQEKLSDTAILLGPSASPVARVNNRYYYQVLVKYKKETQLDQALKQILLNNQENANREIRVSIDKEPQNFI